MKYNLNSFYIFQGAKKKLTKKEKQRLEAEKAEVLRVEMEKDRCYFLLLHSNYIFMF